MSRPSKPVYRMLILAAVSVIASAMPAGAANLKEFGRCLAREGATFYGASWCPYCRSQQQLLGEAMSHVRYVECSTDGDRGESASACVSAKVDSFPTWVFGDGTRASGAQSLAALASKTGCTLPTSGGTRPSPTEKKPEAPQAPSGPKIIQVPQE